MVCSSCLPTRGSWVVLWRITLAPAGPWGPTAPRAPGWPCWKQQPHRDQFKWQKYFCQQSAKANNLFPTKVLQKYLQRSLHARERTKRHTLAPVWPICPSRPGWPAAPLRPGRPGLPSRPGRPCVSQKATSLEIQCTSLDNKERRYFEIWYISL